VAQALLYGDIIPKSRFFSHYSIFQSVQKLMASHFLNEIMSIIQFCCTAENAYWC